MRTDPYKMFKKRIDDFIKRQNPELNEQLYSLMQIKTGSMKEVTLNGRVAHETSGELSLKDAQVYFASGFSKECCQALQEKYPSLTFPSRLQDEFSQGEYLNYCRVVGVKS